MKKTLVTVFATATILVHSYAQDATVKAFQTIAFKDLKPLEKEGWVKTGTQNVDFFFTNLVSMKINKWLGTTFSLDMVYDDDVLKKTQVKEIFGLGCRIKL